MIVRTRKAPLSTTASQSEYRQASCGLYEIGSKSFIEFFLFSIKGQSIKTGQYFRMSTPVFSPICMNSDVESNEKSKKLVSRQPAFNL